MVGESKHFISSCRFLSREVKEKKGRIEYGRIEGERGENGERKRQVGREPPSRRQRVVIVGEGKRV